MVSTPPAGPDLPAGYTLRDGTPDLDAYLRLRAEAGLTVPPRAGAAAGLHGAWAACHVVDEDDTPVAMGRVLGDGGWTFHVVDMAVLPAHQRRGLGGAVLDHLLAHIERAAPEGAYVSLLGDGPGQALYRSRGIREDPEVSLGMWRWTDRP